MARVGGHETGHGFGGFEENSGGLMNGVSNPFLGAFGFKLYNRFTAFQALMLRVRCHIRDISLGGNTSSSGFDGFDSGDSAFFAPTCDLVWVGASGSAGDVDFPQFTFVCTGGGSAGSSGKRGLKF